MFKQYYFVILTVVRKAVKKFYLRAEEKKRSLTPWSDYSYIFLFGRLDEEIKELDAEIYEMVSGVKGNEEKIMLECLDVVNFATFIHEKAQLQLDQSTPSAANSTLKGG